MFSYEVKNQWTPGFRYFKFEFNAWTHCATFPATLRHPQKILLRAPLQEKLHCLSGPSEIMFIAGGRFTSASPGKK